MYPFVRFLWLEWCMFCRLKWEAQMSGLGLLFLVLETILQKRIDHLYVQAIEAKQYRNMIISVIQGPSLLFKSAHLVTYWCFIFLTKLKLCSKWIRYILFPFVTFLLLAFATFPLLEMVHVLQIKMLSLNFAMKHFQCMFINLYAFVETLQWNFIAPTWVLVVDIMQ